MRRLERVLRHLEPDDTLIAPRLLNARLALRIVAHASTTREKPQLFPSPGFNRQILSAVISMMNDAAGPLAQARATRTSPLPRIDPPLLARIGPPAGGVVDVIALPVACSLTLTAA
jgi:hypothetical protein